MIATPYGIRDIKITPYTDSAATTLDTASIDLPYAQTLKFSETEEFDELRGDDKLVTTHGQGPQGTWELGAGGISLDAVVAMTGGHVTTSGASPEITTLSKMDSDVRPWFKLEGQAISDSGGDFHVVLYRCKMSDTLDGELSDATFFVTSCKGLFLGSAVSGEEGKLWDFVANATKTAIA